MTSRLVPLAAVLAATVLAAALSAPAAAAGKPSKAKVQQAHKGTYAGADGRKNH